MQFIDLKAQQKLIRQKIDQRIKKVLDHGQYIMGPEVEEIEEKLSFLNRPIEILCLPQNYFLQDIPRALLGTTRSYPIVGPNFPTVSIKADIHTARAHWNLYNPLKYHSGYRPQKSLIIAKQLFRSVGVIQLIENQRFSRHLPTCLQWAWEIAPLEVAKCYQNMWNNINQQNWDSIDIDSIHTWLKQKENQHQLVL